MGLVIFGAAAGGRAEVEVIAFEIRSDVEVTETRRETKLSLSASRSLAAEVEKIGGRKSICGRLIVNTFVVVGARFSIRMCALRVHALSIRRSR